jgi:HlyD family secretion protein
MKKKTITYIVIAAVVIGGVTFTGMNKNKPVAAEVKTAQVSQGQVKAYLSTTAVIKSKNSKDYYPIQGKVKKVNVKIGDSVNKRQVLAEFDINDPSIAVKQAQLNYDNAVLTKQSQINSNNEVKNNMADLDKQLADLDNQIAEAKKNPLEAAKAAQLETQKATIKTKRDALKMPFSSEQLKQADNNISLQKLILDNAKNNASKAQSSITAEFDGVVTALNLIEGSTVTVSSQPAVTVQEIENLKAVMSVGKYDAAKIQLGQEAVIKDGQKEYKGKVSFVEPAAKKTVSASGTETTIGVEIDILDKPEGLKIDFDTDVEVLLGQAENVLKVPAESIRSSKEEKNYVFVVEEDKLVEKEVKLGLQSDMEAEVVEGLKSGDKVILNPNTNMKPGDLVKEAEVAKK